MNDIDQNRPPFASGIDTLYYFAQSGAGYDRFFENLLDQIDDKKATFKALNYAYNDDDIIVTINTIDLKLSGTGRDGFLWFSHEFFRIGFKDSEKAQNIHNIRVQLNAIGIYTLGIESLIQYVNTKLLEGILINPNYFPVTRIDVNMFVQHNFNYLHKNMILSKKKNHSANITERSSGYELETYYVGKKPFLLRIYNKLKELQNASEIKRELMYNHFRINGLEIDKPIFNVEFEFHREFLTQYGIDTIADALARSKSLFTLGCELVRVLDISTLTNEQIASSNRKRADTLPIWDFIKNNYDNTEFMQLATPLEKIEKISYRYSLEDGRKPLKRLIKRLLVHKNDPTLLYFFEVLQSAKEEYALQNKYKELQKAEEQPSNDLRENFKNYSNEGLMRFEEKLSKEMCSTNINDPQYDYLLNTYNDLHDELVTRGLAEIPF
ncbi:MAG: hypothetical protein AB7E13_10235 [Arcobacteraceae bacterium]